MNYVIIYNFDTTKTKNIYFLSLNLIYKKFQCTIVFALVNRFDLFLHCWKVFNEFYNLIYFNIYYIAWFVCVFNAFNCIIQNLSFDVLCAKFNSEFLIFRINWMVESYCSLFIDSNLNFNDRSLVKFDSFFYIK